RRRLRCRSRSRADMAARPATPDCGSARVRPDLSEDSERRLADRQLVELRVEAADVLGAAVVAALDVDTAHRQRLVRRADCAELARLLGRLQEVEVDLDVVD